VWAGDWTAAAVVAFVLGLLAALPAVAAGPCWTIAQLDAGQSRTLRLGVEVSASTPPGSISNTATLTFGMQAPQTARARIRVLAPLACPSSRSPIATAAC
jgi:hypothetical protein